MLVRQRASACEAGCAVLLFGFLWIGLLAKCTATSYVVAVEQGRLAQVEAQYRAQGYIIKQRNIKHGFLVVNDRDSIDSESPSPANGDESGDLVTAAAAASSRPSWANSDDYDTGAEDGNSKATAAIAGDVIFGGGSPVRTAAGTSRGILPAAAISTLSKLAKPKGVVRVEIDSSIKLLAPYSAKPQKPDLLNPGRALTAVTNGSCPPPSYGTVDKQLGQVPELVTYGIAMVEADHPTVIQLSKAYRNRVMWCILDSGLDIRNSEFDPESTTGCLPGTVRPDNTTHDCSYKWFEDKDGFGHGTHVSGLIAAKRNGKGILGVSAEGAYVYHYNIFGNAAEVDYSSMVPAWEDCLAEFDYRKAATATPDMKMVISMSVGGQEDVQTVADTITAIVKERPDVLFLSAAGNGGIDDNLPIYPANHPDVVSVAAVNAAEQRPDYSTYNPDVEWAAPGHQVLSTVPPNLGGYSMEDLVSISNFTPPADYPALFRVPPMLALTGSGVGSVTGTMVDCGIADTPCANATDKLCLIQRGGGPLFCEKVLNCLAGGGKGVLIYGRDDQGECEPVVGGTLFANIFSCSDPEGGWPVAVTSSRKQGLIIKDFITGNPSARVTLSSPSATLKYLSGTSMATPIAAGVAGVIWSAHPECSASQLRAAISASAKDVGAPGRDVYYGYGIVKALAAHNYLLANPCGDCIGNWTDWSACDKQCGGGVQTSTFVVTRPGAGKPCEAAAGEVRNRTCQVQPCVVRAVNDILNATSGTWTELDLLANDGQSGQIVKITATQPKYGGTVQLLLPSPEKLGIGLSQMSPPTIGAAARYLSRPGFVGTDRFNYTVVDSTGGSSTATVAIRVGPASCASSSCATGICDPAKGRCVCAADSGMQATFAVNPNAQVRNLTPYVSACRFQALKPVEPFTLKGATAMHGSMVAITFVMGSSKACAPGGPLREAKILTTKQVSCPIGLQGMLPQLPALPNAPEGLINCSDGAYTYAFKVPTETGCYRLLFRLTDFTTTAAGLKVV